MDKTMDFWTRLDTFIAENSVVPDRPAGSTHPRYHEIVYPLDYGFLQGTSGGDDNEIDVWRGSLEEGSLAGVICTADSMKHDTEIKLLIGCTEPEMAVIERFHNEGPMSGLLIRRP